MASIVLDSPLAGSNAAGPPSSIGFSPSIADDSAGPPPGSVVSDPTATVGPPAAGASVVANPTVTPPSGGGDSNPLDAVGQFFGGVAQGAWDGVSGIATGVGALAQGAWGLATGNRQTWDQAGHMLESAGGFIEHAATDPVGTAQQAWDGAGQIWHTVSGAYQQAAADGQGAAFIGHAIGEVGVLAAGALIPGADEAEGAGLAADGLATVADGAAAADTAASAAGAADATTAAADGAVSDQAAAAADGTEPAPTATAAPDPLQGRTPDEFDSLARDPAHGNQIDAKSIQERQVGLDIEARGGVPGPITRDPTGAAEFIDGSGQAWDVKGFNSNFPARKGGFSCARDASKVDKSLAQGENVMLDTSKMSQADIEALRAEGEQRGWGARVQWWP